MSDNPVADDLLDKLHAAEVEIQRLRLEIVGACTDAGSYMPVDSDPTAPGEIRAAVARIAARADAAEAREATVIAAFDRVVGELPGPHEAWITATPDDIAVEAIRRIVREREDALELVDAVRARADAAEAALRERDAEIERLKRESDGHAITAGCEVLKRKDAEDEVERLTRSAQYWESEALRYAQNAGHHEKREAESRRLLERIEPTIRGSALGNAIRANLAGGEPAGSSISPYDPEAVAKALAGGER